MAAAGGRSSARPRRRARTSLGLAAAGLALLCGCASTSPVRAPVGGGPAPAATATTPRPATPATAAPPTATGVTPMARSLPLRLRVPAIGVDTAVIPLGLNSDGTARVPPIAAHAPAGWYDGSPTPGQTGPSVLLGHVTVGSYGDGVFLRLNRMRRGDRVMVARADGTVATFAVDSVRTVPKSRFPTASVYGNVDHPALRLITCGGTRVSGGGGYPDNVIVYASLVAGS
ncbi:class F sortase [Streptomyces polygonati]|uniref:Class F sortase n=1 Tax=Streptomyces polygonati TaxID=1617087 RepID=A0ABV8HNE2_9ACTN